jgi:hypothetical protein
MNSVARISVSLWCFALMSSPALAQVSFVIAPDTYSIQRYANRDQIEILMPGTATLRGGENVDITLRLPQPLGIDLGQAATFDTFIWFLNPAACQEGGECARAVPFFEIPATAGYYTSTGGLIPPFSTDLYVAALGGTLLTDATQLSDAAVERTDSAPFNREFGILSEIRASFVVPDRYQTTAGLQMTIWLTAGRSSGQTTPLLVQGKDLGTLQIVADVIEALQQAGVDPGTASDLGAALRAALDAIAAGDQAAGAQQLKAFFEAVDALVKSGALSSADARALRPGILRYLAGLRGR